MGRARVCVFPNIYRLLPMTIRTVITTVHRKSDQAEGIDFNKFDLMGLSAILTNG